MEVVALGGGANSKNIKFFPPPTLFLHPERKIYNLKDWKISKDENLISQRETKFSFTLLYTGPPFQTSQPVNSENDERRGAVNWQCLDSGAKSNPKIRPNIRRGIFPVSCKPLSTIFTSATQHFTPSPLLTAPIFYILALFCISLA